MDKTDLTNQVAHLLRISGCKVVTSISINHREIDVRAEETQGLIRKTILVECADYARSVGVDKIAEDIHKLKAAREHLKENAVLMHVSRKGYSKDAAGQAKDAGIDIYTIEDLKHRLVNFDAYVEAIEADTRRETILKEYQPTKIHPDGNPRAARPAMEFLKDWAAGSSQWLTILGDYGVGKSWTLRRFLYEAIGRYKADPDGAPLPFFIPLQNFTKAFDYQNLILRTFQLYNLSGVRYEAFEYLAHSGQILFLFDSFDEMAQHLHRDTIRENLKELLAGLSGNSKAIMTSRPTYFESRAERLLALEDNGTLVWHPLDKSVHDRRTSLSQFLTQRMEESNQFSRLMDLTETQRKRLFQVVLGTKTKAYKELIQLLDRFKELGSLSQRAVIARLLTTVAETLASEDQISTVDGVPLIPNTLDVLNQAKVFEIVVYNLLHRDQGIGLLLISQRLNFLRAFAIYLQQPNHPRFAEPDEIRQLVETLFKEELRRTDTPEQLLENFYRTCRRHSGLTTEKQFGDSSGQLDMPVEEYDLDSRVGFSHNSLREYLVAEAFADSLLNETIYDRLETVIISEAVSDFFADLTVYREKLRDELAKSYASSHVSQFKNRLFRLIFGLIRKDTKANLSLLGDPARLIGLDLAGVDLSALPLRSADFSGSILPDTDLRQTDLRGSVFENTILDGTMLDGARIEQANFSLADIDSLYVYDEHVSETKTVLKGREARQWLYSHGAIVRDPGDLNPLLGRPWYTAAREVMRTLEHRIAGTHKDSSLSKGVDTKYRIFSDEFVDFLLRQGVLERVKRADSGGSSWVVRVSKEHRKTVTDFSKDGKISEILKGFFSKYVQ